MPADRQSVFGLALADALAGGPGRFLLERLDDGESFPCEAAPYLSGDPGAVVTGAVLATLPSPAKPVLDIGAGAGRLMARASLDRGSYVPLEPDPEALRVLESLRGSGRSIPGTLSHALESKAIAPLSPSAVAMAGGNLGLAGTVPGEPADTLASLLSQCPSGCVLVASGRDPSLDPRHSPFWRGRASPFYTARLSLACGTLRSDPFRWWMPSAELAATTLLGAGWTRVRHSPSDRIGGFVVSAIAP